MKLFIKMIRDTSYLYWKNIEGSEPISLGKTDEIIDLFEIRIERGGKDKTPMINTLRAIGRKNASEFFNLRPKQITKLFEELNL